MSTQQEFDPHSVPVRPAATVMLVRDGSEGLEVFMLRRTLAAVFAGGMYVFPGGRLDDADASAEVESLSDLGDGEASGLLEVPSGGLAYWVAAIRECFEEAGVLLATKDGVDLRFDDAEVIARFEDYRHQVHGGSLSLVELCEREGLRLTTAPVRYVSHWITPVGEQRRFDTRFFLARAPQAQEPLHDEHETVESLWVRPQDALDRCHRGELAMIPPTMKNLEFLVPHATADAALEAASRVGRPPAILPKLRVDEDGQVLGVALPGDPDFAALP